MAVPKPDWASWNEQAWWLPVAPDKGLFETASDVFKIGVIVLALTLSMLLLPKIRRSRGLERSDAFPGSAAGIVIGIVGSIYIAAQLLHLNAHLTEALRTTTAAAALVAPISFLISLIQPARNHHNGVGRASGAAQT